MEHLYLCELFVTNVIGKAPLLGTLKDVLVKALEMGFYFHGGPILGNLDGHAFPRDFERRVRFFCQESVY
jgi:hypothetical protein